MWIRRCLLQKLAAMEAPEVREFSKSGRLSVVGLDVLVGVLDNPAVSASSHLIRCLSIKRAETAQGSHIAADRRGAQRKWQPFQVICESRTDLWHGLPFLIRSFSEISKPHFKNAGAFHSKHHAIYKLFQRHLLILKLLQSLLRSLQDSKRLQPCSGLPVGCDCRYRCNIQSLIQGLRTLQQSNEIGAKNRIDTIISSTWLHA
mmetsp:Transcript_40134/g.72114  ORF Transcript_40134/g.72114 Transcript_40134/m.72114 type:complete len:203 (+) Transcript_40134:1016-1624(+)